MPEKVSTVTVAGNRWYHNSATGIRMPGVTSVIDTMAKPGLMYGAVKVAANFAVDNLAAVTKLAQTDRDAAVDLIKRAHTREWGRKSGAGTSIHKYVERLMHDEREFKVPKSAMPYLKHFQEFMDEFGAQLLYSEKVVWSEEGYAGRLDNIFRLSKRPRSPIALVDIKTGAGGVWPEAALQQVAYSRADKIFVLDEPEPMPHIQEAYALWLRPEGWALTPLDISEETFHAFLGLLDTFLWQHAGDAVGRAINKNPLRKK